MSVYAVEFGVPHDGTDILGLYSTQALADQAVEDHKAQHLAEFEQDMERLAPDRALVHRPYDYKVSELHINRKSEQH